MPISEGYSLQGQPAGRAVVFEAPAVTLQHTHIWNFSTLWISWRSRAKQHFQQPLLTFYQNYDIVMVIYARPKELRYL
jgi:hypothetical protein